MGPAGGASASTWLARRSRSATRARTRAAKACHSAPPRVAATRRDRGRPHLRVQEPPAAGRSGRRATVPTGPAALRSPDAGQAPHQEPANFSVSVLGASGAAAFATSLLHDRLPRPARPRLRSAVDAELFSLPTPADLALKLVTDSPGRTRHTRFLDRSSPRRRARLRSERPQISAPRVAEGRDQGIESPQRATVAGSRGMNSSEMWGRGDPAAATRRAVDPPDRGAPSASRSSDFIGPMADLIGPIAR